MSDLHQNTPRQIDGDQPLMAYLVREVAAYVGIKPSTLRSWIRRGLIDRQHGPYVMTFQSILDAHEEMGGDPCRVGATAHRGLPMFWPVIGPGHELQSRICIVRGVAWGRPIEARTGVSVAVVIDRHKAGETVEHLASDYELSMAEVATLLSAGQYWRSVK